MKNLDYINKNTENGAQMSEISKKKETNLRSNSTLYFQIGLILCLLASYGLFEMKFQMHMPSEGIFMDQYDDDVFTIGEIEIVSDAPKPIPQERPVAMVITKPPIVKPDTYNDIESKVVTPDSEIPIPVPVNTTPSKTTSEAPPVPVDDGPKAIDKVEIVPIFPGCESARDNDERLACMSEKLAKHIQKKFNTDLASELGLHGLQRIHVQFKIDKKGQVTDIKTRSPYSQLEKEAERVVGKIPSMKPGMQKDTPVSVIYNLPIAFKVQ